MHSRESGVVDHLARDDAHAVAIARGNVGDLNYVGRRGDMPVRYDSYSGAETKLSFFYVVISSSDPIYPLSLIRSADSSTGRAALSGQRSTRHSGHGCEKTIRHEGSLRPDRGWFPEFKKEYGSTIIAVRYGKPSRFRAVNVSPAFFFCVI